MVSWQMLQVGRARLGSWLGRGVVLLVEEGWAVGGWVFCMVLVGCGGMVGVFGGVGGQNA